MLRRFLVAIPLLIGGVVGAAVYSHDRIRDAGPIPAALPDSAFWRMVDRMSEPNGFFRSDNFVSNETQLQTVIPGVQRKVRAGGVYIGVGPEQNFTYIIAFRPAIAFIVDIRRQNAMEHLLYKALIEMASDRAEFLSWLFSRPRPPGLDSLSSVGALMSAFALVEPDADLLDSVDAMVERHLRTTHHFPITESDAASMSYVHSAFYEGGPALTYSMFQRTRGGRGGGPFYGGGLRGMPTYASLMGETDASGAQRGYLATEDNFRMLRDMERRNLIVPLVGDFAGPKALREVGRWVRAHDTRVSYFYTSNVEQYLYQQGSDWRHFYENVATLPIDSASTFIRSAPNRMSGTPYGGIRMTQLVMPIAEQLAAFRAGEIQTYGEMLARNR